LTKVDLCQFSEGQPVQIMAKDKAMSDLRSDVCYDVVDFVP
jgi:hypothetical protein